MGLLIASAIALAACETDVESKTPPRPNVVLITIDTLRPDHLSFYGYANETAPFLARLAQRSTVFSNAFSSSSWTAPATASLFSGQYPMKHGVIEGMTAARRHQGEVSVPIRREMNRIPSQTQTIPEVLRANGYRTFGLGANPNIGPEIGFSRGFENFERLVPTEGLAHASAAFVYKSLVEWLPEIRQETAPYFVYLHFNDPHAVSLLRQPPLLPDRHADKIRAYDDRIHDLDGWLEKTFEALRVTDETVVILVSDHGEAFGEHGESGHVCCSLHGEVNRILMMWSAPALGVRFQRLDIGVSIIDVLPTLLDLLKIEQETDLEGRSLLPLLRSEDPSRIDWSSRPILAHRAEPYRDLESWVIIRDRYKLYQDSSGEKRLFDMQEDPEETRDLSAEQPDRVASLAAELERLRAGYQTRSETSPIELSVEQQERLRALGYQQD